MKKLTRQRWGLFLALLILGLLFVLPTILTVVNSFLSASEIQRSYGAALGSGEYMKEHVILKLVPDIATFEQYKTFLLNADHLTDTNISEPEQIILEEAEAYFNGDISVDEAVQRIQNRVEIYLAERG